MSPFSFGILLLLVSFILDVVLAPHFRVMGVQPDLVLLFVVCYALVEDSLVGSAIGFFGGLLEDLASTGVVGLNAFTKTLVGYLSGLLDHRVSKWMFFPLVVVFIATIFNELAFEGLLFLLGERVPFTKAFFRIVLPVAIYNSLLAPLVYSLIKRIFLRESQVPSFRLDEKAFKLKEK